MTVAAKCNITSSALKILEGVKGYGCGLRNKSIIYENYVEWLACTTINLIICNHDNCVNNTLVHLCTITGDIAYMFESDGITVDFNLENTSSYDPPLSYAWTYETDDFDLLSSSLTGSSIRLRVKPPKELDILVSMVSVVITDGGGCTLYLVCYMSPSGCTVIACPNPSYMTIFNKITGCPGNRDLLIYNTNRI